MIGGPGRTLEKQDGDSRLRRGEGNEKPRLCHWNRFCFFRAPLTRPSREAATIYGVSHGYVRQLRRGVWRRKSR